MIRSLLALVLLVSFCRGAGAAEPGSPPALRERVRLPPGFHISLFAGGAAGAREMALGAKGTLFVGTKDQGVVYAILDKDHDGVADEGLVIAAGLSAPNGVAIHDGALFIADAWRILRIDDVENHLEHPPRPTLVHDGLPHDPWHGWKFIAFGPDGWLYVPVGAPCNTCEKDAPYASINRMKPDGSGLEVFARGIRNTVGFDWDPKTRELWFTDNGRDRWGDDRPPDELDHAPRKGMNFGFPYCHGRDLLDPEYGVGHHRCEEFTPPAVELAPHAAALGMRFYTGSMFPEDYRGQIFIAEHGSWNRSQPLGARVMVVRPKVEGAKRYEVFAEGWQQPDGKRWGRPVDVLVMPDGALLVSDDVAGAIYRITFGERHVP